MVKEQISFRLDETLTMILRKLSKETQLTITDLLELGVVELIAGFDNDLKYEGVDLKEYANTVKLQKLRWIVSKERQEFLSLHLLNLRIYADVYKLVRAKKKDMEKTKQVVLNYLDIRKKEVEHYKDNKDILKDIKEMKEIAEEKIHEVKKHIEDKIDDTNYLKLIAQRK